MERPNFLAVEELPPKPNRETGTPWPPRAPLRHDAEPLSKDHRHRVTSRAMKPLPPDGEGPVLAWFKSSAYHAVITAAWMIPLMVVGLTAEQGGSVEWMKLWPVWAFVLLFVVAMYFGVVRSAECSAGVEWLRVGNKWVRLYELVEVTAQKRDLDYLLALKDGAGRELKVRDKDLQKDQDVWDLVYNGILHSVIAGEAESNRAARSAFDIPRQKPHWME